MSNKSDNNKRIAKNTIALYFRTFVTMIVGLYTGRVMLQALGVNDYGVNSVVGGIVGFSAILTGAMSQAISRYITYALGKDDVEKQKVMFSTAVNAQLILSFLVALALEIVGIWFLNTKANLPEGRLYAATWVLHCSIITLIINIVSTPYNALIIAHERMGIYAYTSIAEAGLKLAICFIIQAYGGDRLILFAILGVVVATIIRLFYGWYCGKHFEESIYSIKYFDKGLLREMSVFSGWNLFTNGAYVFSTQGISLLTNVFFGVVFNASRAIAITVNHAVQGFVQNFAIAFAPQITKNYAAGDVDYAIKLTNKGTRLTWLMMYIFIVPICMESEMLLKLWLGEVPTAAPLFLRLTMFESLAVCSGASYYKLLQADGRIKKYCIHSGLMAGAVFPLVWISYFLGAPIWISYIINILIFFALNIIRFLDIKKNMAFSIRTALKECFLPCGIVSIVSFIVPVTISIFWHQSLTRFFFMVFISVVWTLLCCTIFGLSNYERTYFFNKAKTIIQTKFHK